MVYTYRDLNLKAVKIFCFIVAAYFGFWSIR